MRKWLVRLVIFGAVVTAGLYVARNALARRAAEIGLHAATGLPVEIAAAELSPFASRLEVRQIRLGNPPGFSEARFAEISRLFVDYRLPTLLTGDHHVRQIILRVDHLYLVKNQQGELNYKSRRAATTTTGSKPATRYRCDELHLHLGQVTIKDFSRPKPTTRTYTLDLDRSYYDITETTDLSRLVLASLAGTLPLPELKTFWDSASKSGQQLFDAIKGAVPK